MFSTVISESSFQYLLRLCENSGQLLLKGSLRIKPNEEQNQLAFLFFGDYEDSAVATRVIHPLRQEDTRRVKAAYRDTYHPIYTCQVLKQEETEDQTIQTAYELRFIAPHTYPNYMDFQEVYNTTSQRIDESIRRAKEELSYQSSRDLYEEDYQENRKRISLTNRIHTLEKDKTKHRSELDRIQNEYWLRDDDIQIETLRDDLATLEGPKALAMKDLYILRKAEADPQSWLRGIYNLTTIEEPLRSQIYGVRDREISLIGRNRNYLISKAEDEYLKRVLQPNYTITETDYPILYNFIQTLIDEEADIDPVLRNEWRTIQATKMTLLEKEMRMVQRSLYTIVGKESVQQRLLMESEQRKMKHLEVYDHFNAGLWNYNPVYILEYRQIPV